MAIIPSGTLVFTGFGDSGGMRYLSPLGVDVGRPTADPQPGAGVDGIVTLPASGAIGIVGGNTPNFGATGIGTFNADGTVRGAYTGASFAGRGGDRDSSNGFYAAKIVPGSPAHLKVYRYDADAALTNSWDITMPAGTWSSVSAMSVNDAGTVVYITAYVGVFASWTIYAASLSGAGSWTGLFLTPGGSHAPRHMGVPGSTDLIVATSSSVQRYNAAGSLQATYSITGYNGIAALSKGLTSSSFWVNAYTTGTPTSSGVTVAEVRYSDGAILHAFTPNDGSFEFDSPFTVLSASIAPRVLPVPTPTPVGPQAKCTPQAQVSGGGIGQAGCNVGGVGRDPIVFSTYGKAPTHTDAATPELLTGQSAIDLWVTLYHKDYPSGTVTPIFFALSELADDPSVYGGRKPSGLLGLGAVDYGLGADTGGFEASAVDIHVSDAIRREVRTLLGDQELEGDEIEVWLGSKAGRAAGTARVLMRAVVQGPETSASLQATLTAVDVLFSFFGPFGAFPNWPYFTIGSVFDNAPADVKARPLSTLYGPKSDVGAKDPKTNEPREKGLVPWHYVGPITISGTSSANNLPQSESPSIGAVVTMGNLGGDGNGWTSDGTVTNDAYHFVARVVGGVMGPLTGGRSTTASPSGTVYGFRTVWNDSGSAPDYYIVFQVPAAIGGAWDPFTSPAPSGSNIRYQVVAPTPTNPFTDWQFIAYWRTQDDGLQWGAPPAALEDWDAYFVLHGASCQGGPVYGSDLGNGDPAATPDRMKLDLASRNGGDVLWPWNEDGTPAAAWQAIFGSQTYIDQIGADGNTYRLTMGFARGAISNDHKNGVVNITCNMRAGVEDVGDGTGNPIVEAHEAEQHWIENFLILQYRGGLWCTNATAPKWPDGTYKVRSTRFKDRQAFTAASIGGVGLTVGWYVSKAQPLPSWFKEWNDSTETSVGLNGHGQISLGFIDETVATDTWPKITHVSDIFGRVEMKVGVARENSNQFSCDYDPDAEKFRVGPITERNQTAIDRFKGKVKGGQPIESTILDTEAHLVWVAKRRMARLGNGLTVVTLPGHTGLLDTDVDSPGVLVTTIEGGGANGWVDRPVQLRRINASLGGARTVTYTAWDVYNYLLIPPGSTNTRFLIADGSTAPLITDVTAQAAVFS